MNKIETFYQRTVEWSYSIADVIRYLSPEKIKKRIIRGNEVNYFGITTHYRGKHYPVIDLDDQSELPELMDQLNSMGVPTAIFVSSMSSERKKYWIVLDSPNKKFLMAYGLVRNLCFGDYRYFDFSLDRKKFLIRTFWSDKANKPFILYGPNQILPPAIIIKGLKDNNNSPKFAKPITDYSEDFIELIDRINSTIIQHGADISKLKYGRNVL